MEIVLSASAMPNPPLGLNWFSKDLLDVLPAAVYVCDADAVIVAFNFRATELWGRCPRVGDTDEKFCGSHKLFRADGTYMPHPETPMAHVLRTGLPAPNLEAIIERPDGSRVTVLVNIAPLFDGSGVQIGAVNCFQDLTAQKQSEKERALLSEELRQSQKLEAIGHLIGSVAHDFNNLLTPIIGSLDLLRCRGPRDEREQRWIDRASQSAERATTLVKRLLAFARRQPLQAHAVNIGNLVTEMTDLITTTAGPQIRVSVDVASSLPLAKADANQLEMAILNLSLNARDAMPAGGTLTISVVSEAVGAGHPSNLETGRYVRLTISDTGRGMDDATAARAVEPFFSTKGIGRGTGLGLSIVDGLAAQLGGKLKLTSKLGHGTKAELWLPVSTEPLVRQQISITAPRVNAMGRVLLVEDEYLVRMNTADMLTECGYQVVEAASAEEALSLLDRELHLDFLVTDQLMPGMAGTDLARSFRARHPGIPVLIVSGSSGADGVALDIPRLAKPFRQSELAAALSGLVRAPGGEPL